MKASFGILSLIIGLVNLFVAFGFPDSKHAGTRLWGAVIFLTIGVVLFRLVMKEQEKQKEPEKADIKPVIQKPTTMNPELLNELLEEIAKLRAEIRHLKNEVNDVHSEIPFQKEILMERFQKYLA